MRNLLIITAMAITLFGTASTASAFSLDFGLDVEGSGSVPGLGSYRGRGVIQGTGSLINVPPIPRSLF